MFDIDGMTALEIVARVAIIYTLCVVLLRITGRRQMSQLSPMDLMAMLLIAQTVGPAMLGDDQSLTGGIIAVGTLFVLVTLNGYVAFRSPRAEDLLQGHPVLLIDRGEIRQDVMHRFLMTDDDLQSILHKHGLLHVRDVGRAYVEPGGEVTIIKREDLERMQQRAPVPAT